MIELFKDISTLIILIILNIIPVINLIVIGYGVKIIKLGDLVETPPKIEKYGEAFIDGLKIIIAIIAYSIVPAIIAGISIGLGILTNPILWIKGFYMHIFFNATVAIGLLTASILGFIFSIFGAMGIIHMIKNDDFGKIFAFSEIISLIGDIGWGRYLSWLILLFIIQMIIVSLTYAHYILSAVIDVFYIVFISRSAHYIYPPTN